ncbi:MAG TPA: MOSC N-terminal beta barrel domain-containing protein [Gaiellaceae bacterium]|nr:MOSC N-terminal beta barrel domain-containing protein [Gaiellaceae bacterium]
MPTVHDISITPVKGLALLHPDEVLLTRRGVEENRRFHLVDAEGRLFNGKHTGALMDVRPRLDGARLELAFPDGDVVTGEVELGDPVETSFYGRPVAGRFVAGPWSEALSEHVGKPVRLVRPDAPGEAVDVHVATLLSLASCDRLAEAVGEPVDHRRFRMLLTLAGAAPHEEDEWCGRTVRAGEATLRIGDPVGRCVVTSRDPDTGDVDLDTLRGIRSYRGSDGPRICFGVYAEVEQQGRVRVGDEVAPL